MIRATSNNGTTTLESVKQITEEQVAAMKANKNAVKKLCRDFHVSHTVLFHTPTGSKTGIVFSKLLRTFEQKIDVIKKADELSDTHHAFLAAIDKLSDSKNKKREKELIGFLVIPVFHDPE